MRAGPPGARRLTVFAVRALAVYAAWFLVYDLWLLPEGRLDAWLSAHVAGVSGGILNLFGAGAFVADRLIQLPDTAGVLIIDGCNGLAVIGLFAGFVVAYPGEAQRRLWFIPAGIFALYIANVARVVSLVWIQGSMPQFFDIAHSFGLQTLFYVVVFALWVLWARVGGSGEDDTAGTESPQPVTVPVHV
jgi:exosortase/archaeosortase family protein